MRPLSILAAATLGLALGVGAANAQATNVAPTSGDARAYYGGGDVPGQRWRHSRAYARSPWGWFAPGSYAAPRRYYQPRHYYYGRRTGGIPPALYHAGDPAFWR